MGASPMLALGNIEWAGAKDILSHGRIKEAQKGKEEFMYNKVILIGRTTSDVDLRYTQDQKAVAQVSLAVNRPYKSANGELEADFIRLVIWGEQAERFANWIKKGYLVSVDGTLRTRSYDYQQGRRVYVTEVIVNSFNNLMKRDDNQGQANNGFESFAGETPFADEDLPF